MELKSFQKDVLADLGRFLDLLTWQENIRKAYNCLWNEKGVAIAYEGMDGMPPYEMTLQGVPQVCLKVPTGGGKTFIGANAVKPIFDAMPHVHPKCVVWLVPSDAILRQTVGAFTDSDHPYRQRLDADFGGRVEVYTKQQLLIGQNFGPVQVDENLSVCVLSYDSFRTSRKDGRKAYQQNGNLMAFSDFFGDGRETLPDADETALIQVIRNLNPVIIVDESHHATSKLSVEMLRNFNPCFVLELTATPKKGSNIISAVDARKLKKEEMVKLPVIVYNQKSQEDVYLAAIGLRNRLEKEAVMEEKRGGRYIRPIVLFQAQPKVREDSSTYAVIRKALIDAGVPAEYIAVKTGEKDEIKDMDLMSKSCPIRYIITVNALKEGWDCPFAYILATIANRQSAVDVEQILGRILRMPYAKANASDKLNLSYAITSSADFYMTLEKVVAGLVNAGFSRRDHRVGAEVPLADGTALTAPDGGGQMGMSLMDGAGLMALGGSGQMGRPLMDGAGLAALGGSGNMEMPMTGLGADGTLHGEFSGVNTESLRGRLERLGLVERGDGYPLPGQAQEDGLAERGDGYTLPGQAQEDGLAERGGGYLMLGQEQRGGSAGANDASLIDTMLDRAESENKVYWESMGEGLDEEGAGIPYEVSQKMKTFYIKPEFRDEAADLLIPQFMVEEEIAFFNEAGHRLLERDDLREGFTLRDRDTMIDFGSVQAELAKVDLDAGAEALPRAFRLNGFENEAVKKWFDSKPSESKRRLCKSIIIRRISKIDAIGDADIARYVERVMENMTDEQLSGLEQSPELYAKKIREKVESLLRKYESDRFHMMMEQDRIMCEPRFHLKEKISPPKSISSIPKSLYEEEDGNLNDYEKKVIYEIAALGNVRWWHRNISRNEFAINGAVTTYPDLIVRMESGKLLLVETKGDHLDNPESEVKARAGAEWANAAGRPFRYFMVFQTREPGYSGAYSYGRFMEIIKGL